MLFNGPVRVLNGKFNVERLLETVREARFRVLFCDYDGTLAPLSAERGDVRPYDGVEPLLRDLSRVHGQRLVFVTGGPAAGLRELLALDPPPTIWGSHGMEELTPDGKRRTAPLDAQARHILDREASKLESALGEHRVERKPFGVAVHLRDLGPERSAETFQDVRARWRPLTGARGISLRLFDGGLELCAGRRTKGDAVSTVLRHLDGLVAAAYLGDDMTDEDGFRAIRGRGASVLVRDELRPTAADLWLKPPAELIAFLTSWREAAMSAQSWA